MTSLEFWRTVTLWVAAFGQTAFIFMYVTLPWWRTYLGRSLFFKALTLTLIFDFAALARMIEWQYEDALFVILYGLVGAGVWAQNISFIRTSQKRDGLHD